MTDKDTHPPTHRQLPNEAHRISFRSNHALPFEHPHVSQQHNKSTKKSPIDDDDNANVYYYTPISMVYLLRHAVPPRLDLLLTSLLVYIRPTHRITRLIRWAFFQLLFTSFWIISPLSKSASYMDDGCDF